MDVTYLGHSSFKLRGKEGTVVTDPFDPQATGLAWSKTKADVITVSHQHQDHNYLKGVEPSAIRQEKGIFTITDPGEYEIQGILIQGWAAYHDTEQGAKRGTNTIYLIEMERIKILHLGDLGHDLSEQLISEIGQVDVLLIPVGSTYTIDHKLAAKITKAISPGYVIPMHYQVPNLNPELFNNLTGISPFLNEMGVADPTPQDKLSPSFASLPEDTQVVVLKT